MGLLDVLKSKALPEEDLKQLGVPLATCDFKCDTCEHPLPSSLKISADDDGASLWKLMKPYEIHLLVSTGKNDWPHDACEVKGLVEHAVNEWKGCPPLTIDPKVNVTLFPAERSLVLIMPFFVWLKDVTPENVGALLDKIVPELFEKREKGEKIEEYQDLLGDKSGVKVEVDHQNCYVFLCSHRTRDKRCGVSAPYMKKEFDMHLRDDGVYRDVGDTTPGGVMVGFTNHVGQHKWACNVLIYRKTDGELIWLARATPNSVGPIYEECVKQGKTFADYTRLVQKTKPVEW